MLALPVLFGFVVPVARADGVADWGWAQHIGGRLPLGVPLRDADGRGVTLGSVAAGQPMVLDLGYYACTSLCGVVRHDAIAALRDDGELVMLSIDPAEGPADAARAQAQDRTQDRSEDGTRFGDPSSRRHYLTGSKSSLDAIAQAAGFPSRRDPTGGILHPSGLVVATPDGVISAYLPGVGFKGADLRAAIGRARIGTLDRPSWPVLLLCHVDPATGRYTLAVERLFQLLGASTVLALAGLLLLLRRRMRPGAARPIPRPG